MKTTIDNSDQGHSPEQRNGHNVGCLVSIVTLIFVVLVLIGLKYFGLLPEN